MREIGGSWRDQRNTLSYLILQQGTNPHIFGTKITNVCCLVHRHPVFLVRCFTIIV